MVRQGVPSSKLFVLAQSLIVTPFCSGRSAGGGMQATVYILRCADGSYYTGLTRGDAEAREWEHNNDPIDGYTARRRPVELVFQEIYDRLTDAIARERQIKGWTRAKKEALIRGDYEALPALASRLKRPAASADEK